MPTGTFVRRKADQNFKPVMAQKHGAMATEWLELEAKNSDIHIVHQFKCTEKLIGPRKLPVDGFFRETNTVYQFQGCYWQGHACHLSTTDYNQVRKASFETLRKETQNNSAYIRAQGYNLVEMRECQWEA